MARATIEQQLAALKTNPSDDALKKALRSEKGMLVATAAELVLEHRREALVEDLVAAFATLGDAKRDPICRGKIAIARTLHDLDEWDDRVFVAGLRISQMEGFDPVDTAGPLRGACALAHVHFGRSNALDVCAKLLADDDRNARIGAAQAAGDTGRVEATALLRYMLLVSGEEEPEVLAVVFESLFALAREASGEFAIELLAEHDARAEAAALALGSLRIADAAAPLAAWSEDARPAQRHRVGYIALALLRSDAGNAVLLDAIAERSHADAVAAAKALATFKDDAAIVEAIRGAAANADAATRKEIESILAQ